MQTNSLQYGAMTPNVVPYSLKCLVSLAQGIVDRQKEYNAASHGILDSLRGPSAGIKPPAPEKPAPQGDMVLLYEILQDIAALQSEHGEALHEISTLVK